MVEPLNRTLLELKLVLQLDAISRIVPLNRTLLELKLLAIAPHCGSADSSQSNLIGIETDITRICFILVMTLNRTLLELKPHIKHCYMKKKSLSIEPYWN